MPSRWERPSLSRDSCRKCKPAFPGRKIYLSHVTPTGREAGEKRLPSIAGRFYAPLDWEWAARKVIGGIKPSLVVIVETEIWPNLIRAAKASGANVIIVNARLSDRSFNRYSWVRGFMRRVFANVDAIYAQTDAGRRRFRKLVANPERVHMVGNLKFDARPPQLGEFARALEAAIRQTGAGPSSSRRARCLAKSPGPGSWDEILQHIRTHC